MGPTLEAHDRNNCAFSRRLDSLALFPVIPLLACVLARMLQKLKTDMLRRFLNECVDFTCRHTSNHLPGFAGQMGVANDSVCGGKKRSTNYTKKIGKMAQNRGAQPRKSAPAIKREQKRKFSTGLYAYYGGEWAD